ncbi:hypothetical protein TNCV_2378951 [Trichonephila clavipes]|uniref:Uncharacterized protein n=1 Tax=Trichonephila clavipes TaxID=2585209 RepID=A0A8X6RLF4_TRICX|nr:hypothetical protein TNCV_2378951 [Trichonephila clavipes]
MPLSKMENTTFAMPSIIDSHDMGLRTVLQSRCPKRNTYSIVPSPIHQIQNYAQNGKLKKKSSHLTRVLWTQADEFESLCSEGNNQGHHRSSSQPK